MALKLEPCFWWMWTKNYNTKKITISIKLDEATNKVISKDVSVLADKPNEYRLTGEPHARQYGTLEEAIADKPMLIDESWLVEEGKKYGKYNTAFIYSKGRKAFILVSGYRYAI